MKNVSVGQAPNGLDGGLTRRSAHPRHDLFVGEDARGGERKAGVARCVAAERFADARDRLIRPRVIGVHMRVDDQADRFVGDAPNRREQFVSARLEAGVDHQHAFIAGLHDDVAAIADDHVDLALDVQRSKRPARSVLPI